MIDSKIKYENYLNKVALENPLAAIMLRQTIEALQDVARYCKYEVMVEENGQFEFDEIFPDLADWLTERA